MYIYFGPEVSYDNYQNMDDINSTFSPYLDLASTEPFWDDVQSISIKSRFKGSLSYSFIEYLYSTPGSSPARRTSTHTTTPANDLFE